MSYLLPWPDRASHKRAALTKEIPAQWILSKDTIAESAANRDVSKLLSLHLTAREKDITESNIEQLLKAIAEGHMAAYEVVQAFCHRAALAHQLTNCLSEINFTDALYRARKLDSHWRDSGLPVGPLHGLPISVTDRYNIADLESACGFVSRLGSYKSARDEGTLVRNLRSLGAIVFCKTNVSQSMMLGETTNNITGSTVNPYNTGLTAGGACGGEGALIALRGSPLGLAIDMVGSTRIPASFCGLYGLKVSEGRLPMDGIESVLPGLLVAAGTIGLISSDQKDLQMIFKVILDSKPWHTNHNVVELPWRQEKVDHIYERSPHPGIHDGRLTFGMMKDDEGMSPFPDIRCALDKVEKCLKDCGHEVVRWEEPYHYEITETLFKIFDATSRKQMRRAIDASGEPPISQLKEWYEEGDRESLPTDEFWKLCDELENHKDIYRKYWLVSDAETESGRPIDGVIMPVSVTTYAEYAKFQYYGYTAVANAMDLPSCTFPVRTEIPSEKHSQVGLQVMCQRHQEEKVLALVDCIVGSLARLPV